MTNRSSLHKIGTVLCSVPCRHMQVELILENFELKKSTTIVGLILQLFTLHITQSISVYTSYNTQLAFDFVTTSVKQKTKISK